MLYKRLFDLELFGLGNAPRCLISVTWGLDHSLGQDHMLELSWEATNQMDTHFVLGNIFLGVAPFWGQLRLETYSLCP
jgi:hypothetical protein